MNRKESDEQQSPSVSEQSENRGWPLINVAYGAAVIGMLGMSFGGCGALLEKTTDRDEVIERVEDRGYTNVEITDIDVVAAWVRGCGYYDSIGYDITAVQPESGKEVDFKYCDSVVFGGDTKD